MPTAPTLPEMIADINNHYAGRLNTWEQEFMENINETVADFTHHKLTVNQVNAVTKMYNKFDEE